MYRYEIHQMNTKNSCKLHVPKYRTKRYGGSDLYYLGAKMFNELPTKLTHLQNVKQFNIQLRGIDRY